MKLIVEKEYGSTVRKAYIGKFPDAVPYCTYHGLILSYDSGTQIIINQRNYYDNNKRKLAKKLRTYICVEDENDTRHNRPDLFSARSVSRMQSTVQDQHQHRECYWVQ